MAYGPQSHMRSETIFSGPWTHACKVAKLKLRYDEYARQVAAERQSDPNEVLLFHGCSEEALASIAKRAN
jgi:hypothetical protein